MIGHDFQYREKIPVGILGATGSVGQKFVQLLASHPWFEIAALAASERSCGRPYGEVAHWQMPTPLPQALAQMVVRPCTPPLPCSIVFSALDSSVAGEVEEAFADQGYCVISNSRNHRMDPDIPLVIPEVNGDHLRLVDQQKRKGKIVTNPNCSVIGLAMALKPLDLRFGVEAVQVVTLQAISGAGFKGRKTMDIEDSVIPFIRGEEQKIEMELQKILGKYEGEKIAPRSILVSAHCNRVPVSDGHMLCVSVKLNKPASEQEVLDAWTQFSGEAQQLQLPSAPLQPIRYFPEEAFPQTKYHRDEARGMAVSIGRLRKCPLMDYKFVALSHNTIRGAAGCALLIAEEMAKKGMIYW